MKKGKGKGKDNKELSLNHESKSLRV